MRGLECQGLLPVAWRFRAVVQLVANGQNWNIVVNPYNNHLVSCDLPLVAQTHPAGFNYLYNPSYRTCD